MTKKEQIANYIKDKFIVLKKEFPDLITIEKYKKAVEMFQNSEKSLEEIEKEIDNLINIEIEKYKLSLEKKRLQNQKKGFTLNQIKESYTILKQVLKENEKYISLAGGIVPYFLLNKDSNRLHSDIDTLCNIKNMSAIRESLQQSPYYNVKDDSLSYSLDKKDYGFSVKIMDVPIGFYPYSFHSGILTQYSYDAITHEAKEKCGQIEELGNYITNYTSLDGINYNTMRLEYIKKSKDILNRKNDQEDSNAITGYGYKQDLYDRIIPFKSVPSTYLIKPEEPSLLSKNEQNEQQYLNLKRNRILTNNPSQNGNQKQN